jgi:glycosyltransferase involved in cell wall biosynthesis
MNYNFQFTICTAVYNGEEFLQRAFRSLLKQTYRNFEWVIINDFSTDKTIQVVEKIKQEESFFPVRFQSNTANRGKYYSTNRAVELAEGEFFLMLDADDELVPNALEVYIEAWESIPEERRASIKGITALRRDQFGQPVAPDFPSSPVIDNLFTMRFKHGCIGDYFHFIKTDIMKAYPFEENVDRKILDSATWLDMSRKYDDLFINEIVLTYHRNQPGHVSLSTITKKIRFLHGFHFSYLKYINDLFDHIPSFIYKIKVLSWYYKFGRHCKYSIRKLINDINSPKYKLLFVLIIPIGMHFVHQERKNERV